MRLKYRFSLTVFVTGLVAVFFSYVFYFNSHKSETLKNSEQTLQISAEELSSHLIDKISSCIAITKTISAGNEIIEAVNKSNIKYSGLEQKNIDTIKRKIEEKWSNQDEHALMLSEISENKAAVFLDRVMKSFSTDIGEVFLTDRSGITVAATGELTTLTHSSKYWWKKAFNDEQGQVFIDDRGFDESVSGYVIGIVVPVMDEEKVSGILKINFKLSSILEEIVDSGENIFIARSGGLIVMDKCKNPLSKNIDKSLVPFLSDQNKSGRIIFNDKKYIAASSIVKWSYSGSSVLFGGKKKSKDHKSGNNNENWNIIVLKEKSKAFESLYHTAQSISVIFIIITILLAIAAYLTAVFFTKPVLRLSETVSKIGKGNFTARAAVKHSNEIGYIAGKINQMADNLLTTTASKKDLEEEIIRREQEEKKYNKLFNTMSEGFALNEIITNDEGIPVDYRFHSINPSFEKYTGLKASDAIGKTVKEILPKTENYWINTFGRVAITGEPVIFDNYSQEFDKYFSCSAFSPEPGFFAVLFIDITDQKKLQKQLSEEKEQLAVTLRSIGDGVITTDRKGDIISLNTVAETLTGWTTIEASGKHLNQVFYIINEITGLPCKDPVAKVIESESIVELENNTVLISREGREHIIEDSAAPIINAEGEITGVVLVFRDATEKKKHDHTLIRNQRLESLGKLSGGIAHDFNNFLSGIFGYVELAKSGIEHKKYDMAEKSLDKISGVFEKTKNLTHKLITFAQGGIPNKEVINLKDVINENSDFSLSGSNHKLELIISEDLGKCCCDKEQITQCIENLILNSSQSMQSSGIITIKAGNEEIPDSFFENGSRGGDFICISVADSGSGINPEIMNKIFDPFFSTKTCSQGLGLSIAYSIVKNHEGWITLDSDTDKGTEAKIYLPVFYEEVKEKQTVIESNVIKTPGKILIMDDEEFIIDILTEMLDMMGYETETADNGDEALKIVENYSIEGKKIDACILDLTIPGGKGGLEIVNDIRNVSGEITIIASSGYSNDPVMANPEKHGFTDILQKPYKFDEIKDLLEKHL